MVIGLLVLAILAQMLVLATGTDSSSTPGSASPAIQVGDTLWSLVGDAAHGAQTTVAFVGDPTTTTILYIFHPECPFCDQVAPLWADHFERGKADPDVRKLAVTRAAIDVAIAYTANHGWPVDVVSVAQLDRSQSQSSLVARSPWVFVFDSFGVLRYQDHGGDLSGVERAVAAIRSDG